MSPVPDSVLIPKRVLGLTSGPAIEGLQRLVTLSVELQSGAILRIAFPLYLILSYDPGDAQPPNVGRAPESGPGYFPQGEAGHP